mgnify:CR=1 FL=1
MKTNRHSYVKPRNGGPIVKTRIPSYIVELSVALRNKGKSYTEIGRLLNVHKSSIRRAIRHLVLPLPVNKRNAQPKRKLSEQSILEMDRLSRIGASRVEIAAAGGVSVGLVKVLRKKGLISKLTKTHMDILVRKGRREPTSRDNDYVIKCYENALFGASRLVKKQSKELKRWFSAEDGAGDALLQILENPEKYSDPNLMRLMGLRRMQELIISKTGNKFKKPSMPNRCKDSLNKAVSVAGGREGSAPVEMITLLEYKPVYENQRLVDIREVLLMIAKNLGEVVYTIVKGRLENYTQKEIGNLLGVSESRVCQLEREHYPRFKECIERAGLTYSDF